MIHKIIENQGKGGTECESVLGSTARVKALAGFWERNAQIIHMVSVNGLLDYCQKGSFDNKEVEAFKAGLAVFGEFCQKAWQESNPAPKK